MSHLDLMQMTYTQHLFGSLYYSLQSFAAGVVFIIHGFFPDYFVTLGSSLINNLNNQIIHSKLSVKTN